MATQSGDEKFDFDYFSSDVLKAIMMEGNDTSSLVFFFFLLLFEKEGNMHPLPRHLLEREELKKKRNLSDHFKFPLLPKSFLPARNQVGRVAKNRGNYWNF